jgi:hypothetical protein
MKKTIRLMFPEFLPKNKKNFTQPWKPLMAKNRSPDGASAESGAGVAMGPGVPGFRFAPSGLPLLTTWVAGLLPALAVLSILKGRYCCGKCNKRSSRLVSQFKENGGFP